MENKDPCVKEVTKIIIALILILAIAGTLLLYAYLPNLAGKTIILKAKPIELNLTKSQYLSISYEINTIPVMSEAKPGQNIYVLLEKNSNGFWEYRSAFSEKPDSGTFIKGNIVYIQGNNMHVEYGIEQYFLEKDMSIETRQIGIKIKLLDGRAKIIDVLKI